MELDSFFVEIFFVFLKASILTLFLISLESYLVKHSKSLNFAIFARLFTVSVVLVFMWVLMHGGVCSDSGKMEKNREVQWTSHLR